MLRTHTNAIHHFNLTMDCFYAQKKNSKVETIFRASPQSFQTDRHLWTQCYAELYAALRDVCMWVSGRFMGKGRNQSCSQPMLWTTCQFQCRSGFEPGTLCDSPQVSVSNPLSHLGWPPELTKKGSSYSNTHIMSL